jgi:hypothetical protein
MSRFVCMEWPARARPTAPEAGALPKSTASFRRIRRALTLERAGDSDEQECAHFQES